MHPRWRWPVALFAVAVLATAGTQSACAYTARGSFERRLQVTGPVQLDVTTGSGSISVRTGDASSVRVVGIIRASSGWFDGTDPEEKVRTLEANPPVEQNGNVIRIGHIEDRELRRNVSISYELVVPVETRLNSETGSGDQSIEGAQGPVKASTGSGNLTIATVGAEVEADTGSGDITLSSINGRLRAETGSGNIRGTGIAGAIVADTGSGDVRVEQTAPGDVDVGTGSGNVELGGVRGSLRVSTGSGDITVGGEATGAWKLDAGSGNITVRLPSGAAFDLNARTSSGRVTIDHPVTVQGSIGRGELRGKVRGGGFLLEVDTGSGDIRIE